MAAAATEEGFQARLFDASGDDAVLALGDLAAPDGDDRRLVWVDLTGAAKAHLPEVLERTGLAGGMPWEGGTNPALGKSGGMFWLRVVTVNDDGSHEDVRGTLLTLISGKNVVISVHETPLSFM